MNEIQAMNLTAQLTHRARGNPPGTTANSAIGNFFPGLEFDLRNIWVHIFEHLALHEFQNVVIAVDKDAPADLLGLAGATIVSVDGHSMLTPLTDPDGTPGGDTEIARDNGLADLPHKAGESVIAQVQDTAMVVTNASSFLQQANASFPPENAVDRNTDFPWITAPQNASSSEQLTVDLGLVREITEIRLHPANLENTNLLPVFPKNFDVAVSIDGTNWQTVVQETNLASEAGQWNSWPIAPSLSRFVRLRIPATVQLPGTNLFLAAIGEISVTANITLRIQNVFEQSNGRPTAVIEGKFAPPGSLTQSLCSPWQNDFRDCGCFYWAASRPDFINVQEGTSLGNNWMDSSRRKNAQGQNIYAADTITHDDLFQNWESKTLLKFIVGGEDEK